jgi:hypothetical protein
MKSLIAASGLMFLMAGPARSLSAPCEIVDRSNTEVSRFADNI